MLLHRGPDGNLGRIGNQVLDDGTLLAGLLNLEEVHARHPAVGHGLVKGLALALANDDVETVVFQVQGLSGALYAIADDGDNFVLEHLAGMFQRKFFPGDDMFVHSAKIDSCHNSIDLIVVFLLFPSSGGI